jgi:hypothetical protein
MTKQTLGLGAMGLVVVLVTISAGATPPDSAATCIRSRPEARYGALGYNHIVHVADTCTSAAECDVSTDVNPQPQHVSVAPKSEIEVNTYLGSPARVFVPKVVCTMVKQ